jgi:hypothetical protein
MKNRLSLYSEKPKTESSSKVKTSPLLTLLRLRADFRKQDMGARALQINQLTSK